jgi:hypothetical protein
MENRISAPFQSAINKEAQQNGARINEARQASEPRLSRSGTRTVHFSNTLFTPRSGLRAATDTLPSRDRQGVPIGLQPTNSDEKHVRLR